MDSKGRKKNTSTNKEESSRSRSRSPHRERTQGKNNPAAPTSPGSSTSEKSDPYSFEDLPDTPVATPFRFPPGKGRLSTATTSTPKAASSIGSFLVTGSASPKRSQMEKPPSFPTSSTNEDKSLVRSSEALAMPNDVWNYITSNFGNIRKKAGEGVVARTVKGVYKNSLDWNWIKQFCRRKLYRRRISRKDTRLWISNRERICC